MPSRYGAVKDRLFRVLLTPGDEPRTWYRIAKDASASYAWTHSFLTELGPDVIDNGRPKKPMMLFELWAQQTKIPRFFVEFQVQNPERFFEGTDRDYAWTTYYGEKQVQGHLFPRRLDFYVPANQWGSWRRDLSAEGLLGGGNVRLLAGDRHILDTSKKVRDRWVVSLPQLILDLIKEGGPCREAAELLIASEYGAGSTSV